MGEQENRGTVAWVSSVSETGLLSTNPKGKDSEKDSGIMIKSRHHLSLQPSVEIMTLSLNTGEGKLRLGKKIIH